jgi:hypothetical protein
MRRKENGTRGCPCKGKNMKCNENCRCGTRNKPFKNKVNMEKGISFIAIWLQNFNILSDFVSGRGDRCHTIY